MSEVSVYPENRNTNDIQHNDNTSLLFTLPAYRDKLAGRERKRSEERNKR